jgi:hypothetical protein
MNGSGLTIVGIIVTLVPVILFILVIWALIKYLRKP